MNNFDFVEDVLKKAKSSYDISEDKQLQQAKSARWLGKISSKCIYFIDNPF